MGQVLDCFQQLENFNGSFIYFEPFTACRDAVLKKLGGENRTESYYGCPVFVTILLVNAEGCEKARVL
jgi:hypothetical protein